MAKRNKCWLIEMITKISEFKNRTNENGTSAISVAVDDLKRLITQTIAECPFKATICMEVYSGLRELMKKVSGDPTHEIKFDDAQKIKAILLTVKIPKYKDGVSISNIMTNNKPIGEIARILGCHTKDVEDIVVKAYDYVKDKLHK